MAAKGCPVEPGMAQFIPEIRLPTGQLLGFASLAGRTESRMDAAAKRCHQGSSERPHAVGNEAFRLENNRPYQGNLAG